MSIDFTLFRKNLAFLRASREITQSDLSKALGMNKVKRIADLERFGAPDLNEVDLIATFFGCTIDEVLNKKATVVFIETEKK